MGITELESRLRYYTKEYRELKHQEQLGDRKKRKKECWGIFEVNP